jgi:hypothetical protein
MFVSQLLLCHIHASTSGFALRREHSIGEGCHTPAAAHPRLASALSQPLVIGSMLASSPSICLPLSQMLQRLLLFSDRS